MISLWTVLNPILAKRMINTTSTATDMKPPVVESYYGSPLYLRSLLLGNRSNIRRILLVRVKHETIFFLKLNDNMIFIFR